MVGDTGRYEESLKENIFDTMSRQGKHATSLKLDFSTSYTIQERKNTISESMANQSSKHHMAYTHFDNHTHAHIYINVLKHDVALKKCHMHAQK